MDAVTAITRDHHEIRELVEGLCGSGSDAQYFLAQLRLRLAAHGTATEAHVYGELLSREPDSSELIAARLEGHRGLETQLAAVEHAVGTEEFAAVRKRFRANAAAELDLEEETVLPLLRESFGAEALRRTGYDFELRRLSELDAWTPGEAESEPPQEPTA